MEVVLKEDIPNLGQMGEIVRVRDGYARNYLVPRGLVVVASKKNLKALEHEKRVIAQRRERMAKEARSVSDQLSNLTLEFPVKVGEEGRLFGSVTNQDIEKALQSKGMAVERRRILLPEPIKMVGEYEVPVRLAPDVTTHVKVTVLSDKEESAPEV